MPAYVPGSIEPRQELMAVMRQGTGMNQANIWQDILPEYPVTHKTGHLLNMTIALTNMMRVMDKIVAPGANIERTTLTFGDQSYTVVIRKEEIVVPDEDEMTLSDYFSIEAVAAQGKTEQLELTHEYLTANAINSTATFGAATNSLVAYTEANIATISLIADIIAAVLRGRAKGERYNTVIIPFTVFCRVRRSGAVLDYVRGTLSAQSEVNETTLLAALKDYGIEKLKIGESLYNTAAEGATPSLTEIWATTYIWVGRTTPALAEKIEGLETISGVGATLYWSKFGMQEVQTYRDEDREQNVVRAKTSATPYIANANSGTLIATQYA